jgi:hypothetical protein
MLFDETLPVVRGKIACKRESRSAKEHLKHPASPEDIISVIQAIDEFANTPGYKPGSEGGCAPNSHPRQADDGPHIVIEITIHQRSGCMHCTNMIYPCNDI